MIIFSIVNMVWKCCCEGGREIEGVKENAFLKLNDIMASLNIDKNDLVEKRNLMQ